VHELLAAAVLWLPLSATAAVPQATSTTLDNGLHLVIIPMSHTDGVVAWQLRMDVGSGDEVQTGRTGFAHFFEHLLFHGSQATPRAARERALLALGVEENAWTWFDQTVYHAVVPADSLADYAALEADRLSGLHLTADIVRREAGAVYGEYRKGQADPMTVLLDRAYETAFTTHPYGHSTLGLLADIEAMPDGLDTALAFHDLYYRPERATLLLAGDVDPASATALIEDRLGAWEPGTDKPPRVPVEPRQRAARRVEVAWPTATAPLLSLSWKIPAHHPDAFADNAALSLAGMLLTGATGSLTQRLVHDDKHAYAVLGWSGSLRDPGLMNVIVRLREDADVTAVEAIVREEVAALGEAVDPARLAAAQARVAAMQALGSDDPVLVADAHGDALFPGTDLDTNAARNALLDAHTGAVDVPAAVRTHLIEAHLTVGVLRQAP